MSSILNPYLNFENKTKEAMEFYKTAFGGKLAMSTYKEGGATTDPVEGEKIMHAMLKADNGMTLMAADIPSNMEYKPGMNVSLSLSGNDEAELKRYWDTLSVGGKVTMPLSAAPWGDIFGMFTDKFGVQWLVNIAGKKE